MQMKSISKVQFGQLNDKRFYFANGILSLPYGHPLLENVRKQKDKYRDIHKVIQTKKEDFLKEKTKVIEKIPSLNILNQIFNQVPLIYELDSETNFFKSGWNTTKERLLEMASVYNGQFYGNILVVGRTNYGKTTFIEKLGLNNFFGDIIKTEWISGIDIDKQREAEIQSYFKNETEVHIAQEQDKPSNNDHMKTLL